MMENERPKMNAKDFFLSIALLITLYVGAVSFLIFLFQVINYSFPDRFTFMDPLHAIRTSVSVLVVVFPLYLFLQRYISKYLTTNPEKKSLAIRKWLIFLTLFITGITLAIDLIVLINYFLDGELTTRFILKVIALIVVAGGIFMLTLYNLKEVNTNGKRNKILTIVVAITILASIIAGLIIVGSPNERRREKDDMLRINDLQNIQYRIINYWQAKGELPMDLSDLNDTLSRSDLPKDPETQEPYDYEKTSDLSFKLCTNFNSNNSESFAKPIFFEENYNWGHSAGYFCFERIIDPDLYPSREKINGELRP